MVAHFNFTSGLSALVISRTRRSWTMLGLITLTILSCGCATNVHDPRESVWQSITGVSRAQYLGNDEMRLSTLKPLLLGGEALEYALLARASGEALLRGYDGFSITMVDYTQDLETFRPSLPSMMSEPIESYKDLVVWRTNEVSRFGRIREIVFVVEFHDGDRLVERGGFDAQETYDALTNLWADRYM